MKLSKGMTAFIIFIALVVFAYANYTYVYQQRMLKIEQLDRDIEITANTYNNYLIAKYMVTLKDNPTFDNIELAYVRKNKIKEEDKDVEIVNFKLSGIFIPKRVE